MAWCTIDKQYWLAATQIALTLCLSSSIAFAFDRPTNGTLSDATHRDSISYECARSSTPSLKCRFTKIKVRRQATPEDLPDQLGRIAEAQKSFRKMKAKGECKLMANAEQAMRTRTTPKEGHPKKFAGIMARTHPREWRDNLSIMESLRKACQAPTIANIEATIRAEHAKNMRTCKVWANSYEQTFEPHKDGSWIHNAGPTGPCGLIEIATFNRVGANSLYNYTFRKLVTNPAGHAGGLASCKLLDQTVQNYSWKLPTFYRGCEYITYGP